MESTQDKKMAVIRRLERCDSVLVALSGGVDSALLLALAQRALGSRRVLAATGVSASLASTELEAARGVARFCGVEHAVLATREMERAAYRANRGDRCLHCRTELFERLEGLARRRGIDRIAYGAIADDLDDDRPGMRAAVRHGVLAPLLEAGLGKAEVRRLAAEAGLPVCAKPASACLASRIPVGTEVTPERLERIDRAERALRELGFVQFRVRHHGEVARLELDPAGDRRLADAALRARVVRALRDAGYRFVALDLAGYRQGSLNVLDTGSRPYRTGPTRDGGQ